MKNSTNNSGDQPATKLVGSANAERLVLQPIYETVDESGEKLVAVNWISKKQPNEPVCDLYHVDQLDDELGDWVRSLRPRCRKVTVKMLKSLEGEEVDAITHYLPWGRRWLEWTYPKGKLLPA
jgi:hypothetical protein